VSSAGNGYEPASLVTLLGVDVGARRIGVAVADPESGTVRALTTINRADPSADARTLRRLADEQAATELIVGLPLRADGREGEQARLTRDWAAGIAPLVALPIAWRDERHTSQRAEAHLGRVRRSHNGSAPTTRSLRAYRARIDREAAAAILRAELDARRLGSRATEAGR
jgi:putative Holliday junction resolvase